MRLGSAARPRSAARLLALAVVLVAWGCGGESRSFPNLPDPEHARAVAANPYLVTCGDLRRQPLSSANQRLVIHAEFKLAREPELAHVARRVTLNRAGRSVYYALTAFCRGREASFKPARLAVEAVRGGRYIVPPRSVLNPP